MLLFNFVKRQIIKILNTFEKCLGIVTRKRETVGRTEELAIDYLITFDILTDVFVEMLVNEEREHKLMKYVLRKGLRKYS